MGHHAQCAWCRRGHENVCRVLGFTLRFTTLWVEDFKGVEGSGSCLAPVVLRVYSTDGLDRHPDASRHQQAEAKANQAKIRLPTSDASAYNQGQMVHTQLLSLGSSIFHFNSDPCPEAKTDASPTSYSRSVGVRPKGFDDGDVEDHGHGGVCYDIYS